MKPYPVALQMYSVREEAAEDFPGVLKKVADIGYAGVEFAGLHDIAPAEVKKIIGDLGMTAASGHGPLPNKDNVNEMVDTAQTLGYKYHIAGFGRKAFDTREQTLECSAALKDATELLKGTDTSFCYHNHWWEFDKEYDGKTPHQMLMEGAPNALAQVDTYWVAAGGGDPTAVISKLGKRAPLLHIKDGPMDTEAAHTAVGSGKMNWESVIGAASDATEWLIVELDRCDTDMMEAVAESYRYLTENGFAKGNK